MTHLKVSKKGLSNLWGITILCPFSDVMMFLNFLFYFCSLIFSSRFKIRYVIRLKSFFLQYSCTKCMNLKSGICLIKKS